jgi:hypothetical protein
MTGKLLTRRTFVYGSLCRTGFRKGQTLIFDHLSRGEIVDDIKKYPKEILKCHEDSSYSSCTLKFSSLDQLENMPDGRTCI